MSWFTDTMSMGMDMYSGYKGQAAAEDMKDAIIQENALYETKAQELLQQSEDLEIKKSLLKLGAEVTDYRLNRTKQQVIGGTVARVGKSGLMLSGSPLEVLNDSVAEIELDRLIEAINYKTEIYSVTSEQRELKGGAVEARRMRDIANDKAKAMAKSGVAQAFSSYASGLNKASSLYKQNYKAPTKQPSKQPSTNSKGITKG